MKKKQVIGLVAAVVLFIAVGVSSVLTNMMAKQVSENMLAESVNALVSEDIGFDTPDYDYIAIVDVVGTIEEQYEAGLFDDEQSYQHLTTMNYVNYLMDDPYNRGILLYVDSPGGTVYESEELYLKLQEYRDYTGNPVWVYMSHYAASGGYMVSMASDYIFANPNTTTGSIGVIMSGYDLTGLYEKLGIRYVSITSGENKDSSSLTDEQIAIYQSKVDECYSRFVEIVADGRNMSEDEVIALADGRTYTGKQALNLGLVDELASLEDVQYMMSDELGVYDYYELTSEDNIFASLFLKVKEVIPKSEAQVLKETAAEMESGVLMYYAKPLQ